MIFESINPFNTQKIAEFQSLTPGEIDFKLKRSASAYAHWKNSALTYRLGLLENLAKLIEIEHEKLSIAMVKEMGFNSIFWWTFPYGKNHF